MTHTIEADEAGRLMLPEELMREIKPHTRYVVEAHGDGLVIYPEVPVLTDQETAQLTFEEWEQGWKIVQEQVSKSWPPGLSAADVISEMRR